MKIENRILVFFLLAFAGGYSQTTLVSYNTFQNGNSYSNELILTDTISIWRYAADEPILQKKEFADKFLIKDSVKNWLYQSEGIFNVPFYVQDSLHQMKWKLTNTTKTILGETCFMATTFFRGRTYQAYYSSTIPYTDGPWKFGGLPGLILEVSSEDHVFKYEATKISRNSPVRFEVSPLQQHSFIRWEDFVQKFIITVENYIQLIRSNGSVDESSVVTLKIDGAEIIYPKVQNGSGIKF